MANKRVNKKAAAKKAVETAPAVKETKMAATAAEIAEAPKQKATKKTADKAEDKFVIQSNGKDYSMEEIKEACKAAYKNGTRKHVKSVDVYLKAENGNLRAYYVINGNADGAYIDL